MAELDDQLARLAAHRGESVPPFDPAAARVRARRNARRRAAWVSGIAACVVALMVAGGLAFAAGSDDGPSVHTPAGSTEPTAPTTSTTPTTTTSSAAASCPTLDGADDSSQSGPGAASTELVEVRFLASGCVDEVLFEFAGGVPAWSASFEPSGAGANEPVLVLRVKGEVRAEDLPQDHRPVGPSGVLAVSAGPQSDGSRAWTIALESQGSTRPFRVVERDGALAIEVAMWSAPRSLTCTNEARHFAYEIPAGWFVDVSGGSSPCTYLAPFPFLLCGGNCDDPTIDYGGITVSPVGPQGGFGDAVVRSTLATTIAGLPATVRELEITGAGTYAAGARVYEYSVDWAPDGVLTIWNAAPPGGDFDTVTTGLDAIAASVRRIP
jgi:hypothetical protein